MQVFQPLPSMTNPMGLCHFYAVKPASVSTLAPPKPLGMAEHLKGLLLLAKMQRRPYIIIVCSKVAPLLHWGYCRSCIRGAHSLVFPSSGLMKQRTGTGHACPVAHSACIPSRMIWHTSTTLSVCITMPILLVGPASVP